jgi:type IV pilus assembly protein PilY1
MKKTTNPKGPDRLAYRQLVTGCTLSAMLFAQNAAALTISDVPLFLPKPMEPNVVLTIDDSSSMTAGYVPESLNTTFVSGSRRTMIRDARSGKSSDRNALYYNPQAVYPRPMFANVDGTVTTPSTSFTAAPINGYADGGPGRAASRGTVNLATEYQPSWEYDPSKPLSSQDLGKHPG